MQKSHGLFATAQLLVFREECKVRNFASIFQLQSPMSRHGYGRGNRTDLNVLGSVDDCSVSSANLVQFVPHNSEN